MLHERKQRLLCRCLFLVLCITPTIAVGSYALWRTQSNWQQRTLHDLSAQLGIRVECQQLTTPVPGKWQLQDVSLRHLETNQLLGTISQVELEVLADRNVCRCGTISLHEESLTGLSKAVEDCLSGDLRGPLQAYCNSLVVKRSGAEQASWQRVTAEWQPRDSASGRRPRLQMISEDQTTLIVERHLHDNQPATHLSLSTGSKPLPWRLFAAGSSLQQSFGPLALFQGTATRESTGRQSDASFRTQGVVHSASLEALMAGQLVLQQPATIQIDQLLWQGDKLAELNATIDAGVGSASRSLVISLNEQLACEATPLLHQVWQRTNERIAFDRFSLKVTIDDQGVRFSTGSRSAGIMNSEGTPLLVANGEQSLPTQNLLYLTAPERIVSLPTGPVAETWARHLPASKPAPRVAEQVTGRVYR